MINVTKTFLPPFEEYTAILKKAWDKTWVTNNGDLLLELEDKIKSSLGVEHLWFCGNGTIVLQMALKALNITKEVITTPFSYVATTNAIIWEGCTPVFADINRQTLCIDPASIKALITKNTEAILATHVYGFPCAVDEIEAIAKEHGLKVIYDGAHAFGCEYLGKSLLSFGDISTCSFHATKLFHTTEGGCIISHDCDLAQNLALLRGFGHVGDNHFVAGINGKNSELHAAMGLAVLPKVPKLMALRRNIFAAYDAYLYPDLEKPRFLDDSFKPNFAYYPVIFESEKELLEVSNALAADDVRMRRYFYPSLNKLPQTAGLKNYCPVSEDISKRIACLPLYHDLAIEDVQRICKIINGVISRNHVPA